MSSAQGCKVRRSDGGGGPRTRRPPHRTTLAALPAAGLALAAVVILGTAVGPVGVSPIDVCRVVLSHVFGISSSPDSLIDRIIWDIRLPRVLLAGLVGSTLAYSGAAYQGVFRNPLADPYLLGVASGAGFAATIVIVGPFLATYGPISVITLAAFVGALGAVFLTYSLGRVAGTTSVTTLVLAGVAVSALSVSATSYLIIANPSDTLPALSWLLGSLNNSRWNEMWYILPYTIPAALVIFVHGRLLNTLQLDSDQAQQLGVNVERTRLIVLIAASLAAASAVAVAGIVGFVGLVVPHVARLLVGPDYRRLLPLSALGGASFLILADLGARVLLSPSELPIGVVTAFVGAPYFLFLLRRHGRFLG